MGIMVYSLRIMVYSLLWVMQDLYHEPFFSEAPYRLLAATRHNAPAARETFDLARVYFPDLWSGFLETPISLNSGNYLKLSSEP